MNINAAISLLKQMIATPSHSREEAAVADIMEQELKRWGFAPRRKGNNVWACSEWDFSKPTILLDAHIDTVRPNSAWSRDPYTPTIEGDKLYLYRPKFDITVVTTVLPASIPFSFIYLPQI